MTAGLEVVIDASVAVKWLLPDPKTEADLDRALALLEQVREGKVRPIQPPHWLAEVSAVIARSKPEIAREAVELLVALELPVEESLSVYRRAAVLAVDLDHHLFDTLYHAVALERGISLVSADLRYLRKAEALGGTTELSSWRPPE